MSGLDRSEAGAEASRARAQRVSPEASMGEAYTPNGRTWKYAPGLREARTTTRSVEEHPKGDLEQRER
jgi:hypothetical protein